MIKNIIELKNIVKKYYQGKDIVCALDNISLDIKEHEILVILGPSGSGKTTFLNVVSGLDNATSGKILYENKNIAKYSDRKITKFRKNNLSYIFQTYNLLEHLNVRENIMIGEFKKHNKELLEKIILDLNLKNHEKKYMYQLSGGEQQRVAIGRALIKKPKVMFCDEPTGALDEKSGKKVLQSLVDVNNIYGTTLLIVTHNPGIAQIADRVLKMNSGKVIEIINNEKRVKPEDISWG